MTEPTLPARTIQLIPGTAEPSTIDCPSCWRTMWVTPIFVLGRSGMTKVGELVCCFACADVD